MPEIRSRDRCGFRGERVDVKASDLTRGLPEADEVSAFRQYLNRARERRLADAVIDDIDAAPRSEPLNDIDEILANLRVVSADLRELMTNAKRYPSQVILGEPPSHAKAGRR